MYFTLNLKKNNYAKPSVSNVKKDVNRWYIVYRVSHECSICRGESQHSPETASGAELQSRLWSSLWLSKGITCSKGCLKTKTTQARLDRVDLCISILPLCFFDKLQWWLSWGWGKAYPLHTCFRVWKLTGLALLTLPRFTWQPGASQAIFLLDDSTRLPPCQSNWATKWEMKPSFGECSIVCTGLKQPLLWWHDDRSHSQIDPGVAKNGLVCSGGVRTGNQRSRSTRNEIKNQKYCC